MLGEVFAKVVLWLLKKSHLFFYLSRIQHVLYLQSRRFEISEGYLSFDWTVPVRGPGVCESYLLPCIGHECPQGSMREEIWDFLALLARDST